MGGFGPSGGFGSDFGSDFGFEQGSTPASSTASNIPSIERLMRTPLVDPQTGFPTKDWMRYLRYNHQRVAGTLDLQGIFTKRNTLDNLTDGSSYVRTIPNEKTGAGRAFQALDSNIRLTGTQRLTNVNAASVFNIQPLSATTGAGANQATIAIQSFFASYPFGPITYNAGSITPLLDNTLYYVYVDDPNTVGGSLPYIATTFILDVTAAEGRLSLGSITTPPHGSPPTVGIGGGNNARVLSKYI